MVDVDGFSSSSKDGVLRIFIAHKISSPSARTETAKVESDAKHASHYTTITTILPLQLNTFILNYCNSSGLYIDSHVRFLVDTMLCNIFAASLSYHSAKKVMRGYYNINRAPEK